MNKIEHRLLALTDSTWRRVREIDQLYKQQHGRISYGTLYVRFRRLHERGLVEQADGEDEDGPWRAYRLTDAGRTALKVDP